MDGSTPSDKELFPNLDPNQISKYTPEYRKAVKDNLSRLTEVVSKCISDYGFSGADTSSAFIQDWYPPDRHRSKELTEVEKQFNSAIICGSIDGFPGIEDLWISEGDVLHTYSVSGNKHKAQIHYGDGKIGPNIKDYINFYDGIYSDDAEHLTEFSYDFLRSDVIQGFSAFHKAKLYLQAKKKQEDLNKAPGCSPKILIACILLTALGVFLQNRGLFGFLPGLMMIVFGALSIGGIFMILKSPKSKGEIKIGDKLYDISPAEEEKIRKAMDDEYLKAFRMCRYLKLWKKHLDESPDAYPEVLDCNGKNVIPEKLQELDHKISDMESSLQIYKTFPSTAGVKRVDF